MPRKKEPTTPRNELDELLEHVPTGNGHDPEGLADAEESGELDEPIIDIRPTRTRSASTQAEEVAPTGKKPRAPRGTRSKRRRDPNREIVELPLLPLRDMVIFPHMVTSLFVGREKSLKAIEAAMTDDRVIVAVAQRNPEDEEIGPNDLYDMGVELVIGRSLKMPDGTSSLLVQGQRRVRVTKYLRTEPYLRVVAEPIEESTEKNQKTEALMRAVLALFEKVVNLSHNLSQESYVAAMNVDEPGWLADLIAASMTLDQERRQRILEQVDPVERLQELSIMLAKELDVLNLENSIHDRVQSEVDKSQREFYLREQMKAIAHELQDYDPATREANDLRGRIESEPRTILADDGMHQFRQGLLSGEDLFCATGYDIR